MQSDGLEQRERLLQREREHGDLRMILAGKDIPEDVKSKMMQLHDDNESLKDQVKIASEKLAKARQVCHQPEYESHLTILSTSLSNRKTSYSERNTRRRSTILL